VVPWGTKGMQIRNRSKNFAFAAPELEQLCLTALLKDAAHNAPLPARLRVVGRKTGYPAIELGAAGAHRVGENEAAAATLVQPIVAYGQRRRHRCAEFFRQARAYLAGAEVNRRPRLHRADRTKLHSPSPALRPQMLTPPPPT